MGAGTREVAVHDGAVVRAGEGGPGIHTHDLADLVAVHACGAPDGDLVDAVAQVALLPDRGVDLRGGERALRRLDVGLGHVAGASARLLDLREHLAHGGGEGVLRGHAADVHEHHLRRVPEEVVVEGGDLEPVVEGHAHDRIHLVFEQDEVAHHHRMAGARRLESGPGGETERRSDVYAARGDGEIAPGDGHLEDALLRIESALGTGQLLDASGIEARRARRWRRRGRGHRREMGGYRHGGKHGDLGSRHEGLRFMKERLVFSAIVMSGRLNRA